MALGENKIQLKDKKRKAKELRCEPSFYLFFFSFFLSFFCLWSLTNATWSEAVIGRCCGMGAMVKPCPCCGRSASVNDAKKDIDRLKTQIDMKKMERDGGTGGDFGETEVIDEEEFAFFKELKQRKAVRP